jgi:hypothetical protein
MTGGEKSTTINHFYEKLLKLKVSRWRLWCAAGVMAGSLHDKHIQPTNAQTRLSPPKSYSPTACAPATPALPSCLFVCFWVELE